MDISILPPKTRALASKSNPKLVSLLETADFEGYLEVQEHAKLSQQLRDLRRTLISELCEVPGIGASKASSVLSYKSGGLFLGGYMNFHADLTSANYQEILNIISTRQRTIQSFKKFMPFIAAQLPSMFSASTRKVRAFTYEDVRELRLWIATWE